MPLGLSGLQPAAVLTMTPTDGWWQWPPANNTDYQQYKWIRQLWESLRDRSFAQGSKFWPAVNDSHGEGTITAITDNADGTSTLTFSALPVPLGEVDDGLCFNGNCRANTCGGNYFAYLSCPASPFPTRYDVIIETETDLRNNPWCVVRGLIEANTNATVRFNNKDIYNHVTAGWLASHGTLVGKKFYVIRQNGVWWADPDNDLGRWLDYPNDQESWRGTVYSGSLLNASTGFVEQLTDPYRGDIAVNWPINFWAGYECMLSDTNNVLYRMPIIGNSATKLYFGTNPNVGGVYKTFSSAFAIVVAGYKCDPRRDNGYHRWFYGGVGENVWCHMPNDALEVKDKAFGAAFLEFGEDYASAAGCDPPVSHAALDVDLWSLQGNYCSPTEWNFSPHLFKTMRGIQLGIENFVPSFLEHKDYSNQGAVPDYTPARAFYHCGINSGTSTMSAVPNGGGFYTFTVPSQYEGYEVYWTAVAQGLEQTYDINDDENAASGGGTVTSGTVVTTADAYLAGLQVIWSAGFTRYHPLECANWFDYLTFIPDVVSDGFGGFNVVDPPNAVTFEIDAACDGVGQYSSKAKATGIKTYNANGYAGSGRVFAEGDMVRYVGDGWADPATGGGSHVFIENPPDTDVANLLKDYWDHFYEGTHDPSVQVTLDADCVGRTIRGGVKHITDENSTVDGLPYTGKSWWSDWFGGGTNKTHSGTAAAGSATTLTTPNTWNNAVYEEKCYFDMARFPWATYPFEGFTLEVDKTVGLVTTTHHLLITNCVTSGTSWVFTFVGQSGFTVAASDVFRLKEPKWNVNRWKGHRIKVYKVDGSVMESHILGNDNNTLFLETALPEDPTGLLYRIVKYKTGGVWMYTATDPTTGLNATDIYQRISLTSWWRKPYGTDPRGSKPWQNNQSESLPHKSEKKYGRICKGDYVYHDTFQEMFDMINSLVWTRKSFLWSCDADLNGTCTGPEDTSDPPDGRHDLPYESNWKSAFAYREKTYGAATTEAGESWNGKFGCETDGGGHYDPCTGYPPEDEVVNSWYGYIWSTSGLPPRAWSRGASYPSSWHTCGGLELTGNCPAYEEYIDRRFSYARMTGVPNLIACQAAFWTRAEIENVSPPRQHGVEVQGVGFYETYFYTWYFDNHGDPVLNSKYKMFKKTSASTVVDRNGGVIGNWNRPNSAPTPTFYGDYKTNTKYNGYEVVEWTGILEWNVSGGMKYITMYEAAPTGTGT